MSIRGVHLKKDSLTDRSSRKPYTGGNREDTNPIRLRKSNLIVTSETYPSSNDQDFLIARWFREAATHAGVKNAGLVYIPQEGPNAGDPQHVTVPNLPANTTIFSAIAEIIHTGFREGNIDSVLSTQVLGPAGYKVEFLAVSGGFETPIAVAWAEIPNSTSHEKISFELNSTLDLIVQTLETSKKSRFHDVMSAGLQKLDGSNIFETIASSIEDGLYCNEALVWRIHNDGLRGVNRAADGIDLSLEKSYAGKAVLLRRNRTVDDFQKYIADREFERSDWILERGHRSGIFLPIFSHSGAVGVCGVFYKRPHGATKIDLDLANYIIRYLERLWNTGIELDELREKLSRLSEFEARYIDIIRCLTALHDVPSIHEAANRTLDSIEIHIANRIPDLLDSVEEIGRALDLIADVVSPHKVALHFAKRHYDELQKSGAIPNLARKDIRSFTREQTQVFAQICRESKIELDVSIHSPPKNLEFDVTDHGIVLRNLIENSARALQNKTHVKRKIEVDVRFKRSSESGKDVEIIVSVNDNGLGISDDIIEKVFLPEFSTYKNAGGRGQGLAIVSRIAHKHGFEPKIDTKWGQYCRVEVRMLGRASPP